MLWIAAAVFVGVIALVTGAYYLLVVRQEEEFVRRLAPITGKRKRLKGVLKPEESMSSSGPLQSAIENTPFGGGIKALLDQTGTNMNLMSFLILTVIAGVGAYLFVGFLTRIPLAGAAAGAFAALVPYMLMRRKRTVRMRKFEEHFPDAIDLVGRALRAGHALPTGLGMVADELPAPIGTEFRILFDEQNFGLSLPDALRNFARRIPVLDARFFVTAVLTQRETGGNLAEVLDNLAQVIRERFKVKRQIRVISAHGRITGVVLACLPPSLAAITLLLNPDYLGTLTGDPLGRQMIMAALVLQTVGVLVMRKITQIEYGAVAYTPELILMVVAVFGSVALGAGTLAWYVLTRTAPERRRLERAGMANLGTGVLLGSPASLDPEPSAWVKRATTIVPRSPKDMTKLRRRFVRAGFNGLTPIAVYTLGMLTLPVLFALIPLIWGPPTQVWLFMAILGLLGALVPGGVVGWFTKRRQKQIQNGLPDALDLMIVCLEAGSAVDQAMLKVSEELDLVYPALAEEFRAIITETRAGKPRIEAFRNFSSRTGVEDVRTLVAMLVQTDKFGTSVSQALRTHAETARTKRRQRAEERAAKIGVKLVFPLVFCLFPAMFVVTLGPAVIRFMRILLGDVMGGQ